MISLSVGVFFLVAAMAGTVTGFALALLLYRHTIRIQSARVDYFRELRTQFADDYMLIAIEEPKR